MPDTVLDTMSTSVLSRVTALMSSGISLYSDPAWVQRPCLALGEMCLLCMGVHVWVHVHISITVSVVMHTHMYTCVWRPVDSLKCCSSRDVLTTVLSLRSLAGLGFTGFGCLVSYGTSWVCLSVDSALGVQAHHYDCHFYVYSRFKYSCLHSKYLADGAISPVPPNMCLIDKDVEKKGMASSAMSGGTRL